LAAADYDKTNQYRPKSRARARTEVTHQHRKKLPEKAAPISQLSRDTLVLLTLISQHFLPRPFQISQTTEATSIAVL
jgi:hypothetical protein